MQISSMDRLAQVPLANQLNSNIQKRAAENDTGSTPKRLKSFSLEPELLSRDDYQRRLETFSDEFYATNRPVTAVQCSWHGWEDSHHVGGSKRNIPKLSCSKCQAEMWVCTYDVKRVSEKALTIKKQYEEGLYSIHKEDCLWRTNSCDVFSVSSFPMSTTAEAFDFLQTESKLLLTFTTQLPLVQHEMLDKMKDKLEFLIQHMEGMLDHDRDFSEPIPTPSFEQFAAYTLPVFGWQAVKDSHVPSIKCHECFRHIELHTLRTISNPNPAKPTLDLFNDHRPNCPWIDRETAFLSSPDVDAINQNERFCGYEWMISNLEMEFLFRASRYVLSTSRKESQKRWFEDMKRSQRESRKLLDMMRSMDLPRLAPKKPLDTTAAEPISLPSIPVEDTHQPAEHHDVQESGPFEQGTNDQEADEQTNLSQVAAEHALPDEAMVVDQTDVGQVAEKVTPEAAEITEDLRSSSISESAQDVLNVASDTQEPHELTPTEATLVDQESEDIMNTHSVDEPVETKESDWGITETEADVSETIAPELMVQDSSDVADSTIVTLDMEEETMSDQPVTDVAPEDEFLAESSTEPDEAEGVEVTLISKAPTPSPTDLEAYIESVPTPEVEDVSPAPVVDVLTPGSALGADDDSSANQVHDDVCMSPSHEAEVQVTVQEIEDSEEAAFEDQDEEELLTPSPQAEEASSGADELVNTPDNILEQEPNDDDTTNPVETQHDSQQALFMSDHMVEEEDQGLLMTHYDDEPNHADTSNGIVPEPNHVQPLLVQDDIEDGSTVEEPEEEWEAPVSDLVFGQESETDLAQVPEPEQTPDEPALLEPEEESETELAQVSDADPESDIPTFHASTEPAP